MCTTCLHCQHALPRNDAIASLPIARRLAFDRDKGRLWVGCPSCLRWNLTPVAARLAFEMAVNEDAERRALAGELATLEAAWREAEDVAQIADRLLIPPGVQAQLEAMRAAEHRHPKRPGPL
jgi:hypothetical protein